MSATRDVLDDILVERRAQDEKWGEQNHDPAWWMVILMEEVGEVARAIFEGDEVGYVAELVQVAAVAVAALESYDRSEDAW